MERGRGGERKEGEGVESGEQVKALASEPARYHSCQTWFEGLQTPITRVSPFAMRRAVST